MADLPSALYFSAVTYTTTGYGDIVLPHGVATSRGHRGADRHSDVWVSTGFFFAAVSRMLRAETTR